LGILQNVSCLESGILPLSIFGIPPHLGACETLLFQEIVITLLLDFISFLGFGKTLRRSSGFLSILPYLTGDPVQ
jgi:hypothetical protein